MILGLDLLGLAHPKWPSKATSAVIPHGCAIGVFDTEFGDVRRRLRVLLDTGKVIAVRVHIGWNKHKIIDIPTLKRRVAIWSKFSLRYPAIQFYISHSCEHENSSVQETRLRMKIISLKAPHCIPVNAPLNSPFLESEVNETHNLKLICGKYIASTDGINIYDIDAEQYKKENSNAEILFYHCDRFNLRENYKNPKNLPPPLKRTAAPSRELIESVKALFAPKGVPPSYTLPYALVKIKKPLLYKSHAEDSEGEDSRELKPCLILNKKADYIEIVSSTNQVLGKMVYGGKYGNLHRYYAGMRGGIDLYGYQIAQRAISISNSPFVYFVINNNTAFGAIHPAFREGYFQEKK